MYPLYKRRRGGSLNFTSEWRQFGANWALVCVFHGWFDAEQAEFARAAVHAKSTSTDAVMIWDCTEMTGFDRDARLIWQRGMRRASSGIREVWVVSADPQIRDGAELIGAFGEVNVHLVDTWSDLPMVESPPS